MNRLVLIAALAAACPAFGQTPDPHAGHTMPMPAAPDPHAGHAMPAPVAADPHAGHTMPMPAAPDPHAGHVMPAPAAPDPHAGHHMPMPSQADAAPAPPVPADHAAERFYSPEVMAAAREQMRREHGDIRWSKVMLELAEIRPASGADGYAWDGRASFGGDVHQFMLKSEGEGARGRLESAEVQALYSRAVSPYWNLQAGLRQDLQSGPRRTYATVGLEGLAPYWFDVEGALFLSNRGDVSARLTGSYDLRLTQKLILEPRAEANFAAQDVTELGLGAGLTDVEVGLRLHYAFTPEFAPYVGVNHSRTTGESAKLARASGDGTRDTRLVVGLRAWF